MAINKKGAISRCKKLWEKIEESGLSKGDFLKSSAVLLWKKSYKHGCPLCEYARKDNCQKCPLPMVPERDVVCRCYNLGFTESDIPTKEWLDIIKAL